ncbi:hypothetical protein B4N84_17665 [Flavobacterium sp. IR1]|nr:hypothetical protein B4N84_17665 [Flavobacterium sp. IR1]
MKKKLHVLIAILAGSFAFAQDIETPAFSGITFGGSADAYYKYDFSKQDNGLSSFTNTQDSFEIGMASINAGHSFGKASVFVDLGFGTRAEQFSYNEKDTKFIVKQLTFTYDITDKFKVVAGSFGTHIGYEVLDAVDNKNYSMSYAFSCGPFFNTGVKAQYTSGQFTAMAGITNPTDFNSALDSGSKKKTYIGQLGYVADKGSVYLNFTTGSANPSPGSEIPLPNERKTEFDLVVSREITDSFSLGFNGVYAKTTNEIDKELGGEWYSLVGYANYSFRESLILAYRMEYFGAKKAAATIGNLSGANVFANTVSLNYKVGKLTIIPEVKYDIASEKIYVDNNTLATGGMFFALLATTYSF